MSFSDREPRRLDSESESLRLPRACTATPGKVTPSGPTYGSHARRGAGKKGLRGHCYSVEMPQAPPARHALHRSVHVVSIVSLPPYVLLARPFGQGALSSVQVRCFS